MKSFVKEVLPNGLSIILIPQKSSPTATVFVLVETGSEYETKKLNGISHFLEHMCFKGTKKRPRAGDVSKELDALGASYNAFTSSEVTGYYVKTDPAHIHKALDVISDIYINQIFKESEIQKEVGVIAEEINMYEDMPSRKVHDAIAALLYGNQPAGRTILGPKENLYLFRKKDFTAYKRKHYVSEATTVIVAGSFNEKKILSDIKSKFKHIQQAKKQKKNPVTEKQAVPQVLIENKKTDQSHLIIGFRAFQYDDERLPALLVLATILGGGMSSRLFGVVRDKLGAAYYIYARENIFTDHGFLGIGAGAGNKKVKKVIGAILAECKRLKKNPVSATELKKAKDYITGKTALSLEATDELAAFYGEHYVMERKIETPAERFEKIKAVSAKDVQNVAREIFQNNRLNLALIGPAGSKKEFVELLRV